MVDVQKSLVICMPKAIFMKYARKLWHLVDSCIFCKRSSQDGK